MQLLHEQTGCSPRLGIILGIVTNTASSLTKSRLSGIFLHLSHPWANISPQFPPYLFSICSQCPIFVCGRPHSFSMATGSCLGPKGEPCECLQYDEDPDEKPPQCQECWHGRSLHCIPALGEATNSTKASTGDKSKSGPGSESDDDMPLVHSSSSLTIEKNKKIITDLRSSLLADTTAFENARNESLKTFHRKEVRYLMHLLLC